MEKVDVQKILNSSLKEAILFKRYGAFSLGISIFLGIVLSPLYVLVAVLSLIYQVNIYLFKLFKEIAKYIKESIYQEDIHLSLLIIIYIIVYPVKFLFDLLVITEIIALAIIHFIFVSILYVASLGGIKYMPYLYEADANVWKMMPLKKIHLGYQILASAIAVTILIVLISVPAMVKTAKLKEEKAVVASEMITVFLYYRGVEEPYEVKEVIYFENELMSNYFIAQIRYNGIERFLFFYEGNYSFEPITFVRYSNYKTMIYNSKKYKLKASIINSEVKRLMEEIHAQQEIENP